jgi:hypothetical protein
MSTAEEERISMHRTSRRGRVKEIEGAGFDQTLEHLSIGTWESSRAQKSSSERKSPLLALSNCRFHRAFANVFNAGQYYRIAMPRALRRFSRSG